MASSRKRNLNQHCNDNEDHDEYRITRNNSCGLLLHDYPSRHVHRRLSHVQVQERFPLRLKLEISESFINKIESTLTQEKQENNDQEALNQPQRPRRMNASNFPAVFLRIGSWNWASRNKGDLMIKFYYGKKKLLWEFIIGSLKKKMEIGWNNVSAINAYVDDDNMGRLEVELMEPPEYYNECNFRALKHTQWERTTDFTQGQANNCKRHSIIFSPGILREHLEKLVQHDTRLLNLSQQPFPIHNSTFFNTNASYNHDVPSVQPITSCMVENLHSNIPILPDVPFPNLDEIAYVNERNNDVWEQLIPGQQLELHHVDNQKLSQDTATQNCVQVDSTLIKSPCGNEMNDNGINHDVGLFPGFAFTEENINTSSSDCGLTYVASANDDVSGFPELHFINDGPEIQDPDSWLSSPHDIMNGELPRQDSNSLGGSSG